MMERIRQRKGEEGLTLIEILVVIIVLGILAGIVVFGIATFRGDSARAACKTDVKSVEVASEAFRAKSATGSYASGIPALVTAGYLKAAPPTNNYDINYGDGSNITGTLKPDNVPTGENADCFK